MSNYICATTAMPANATAAPPFAAYYGGNVQYYRPQQPLPLECGGLLCNLQIAYHTYGALNAAKNNAVWICHALTANSDAGQWWSGLVGIGKVFDPQKYYIVCANVIGSCYGSTGPLSINHAAGKPYYRAFPQVSARDMAAAHDMLRRHLDIPKVQTIVGGSIGAFQAIEWCIVQPHVFDSLIFIAASARSSPWAIAWGEAQRMAIEADPTFFADTPHGGAAGMAAARAIGMLAYRTCHAFNHTQADTERGCQVGNYRAASYQRHQGEKLAKRFDAYSYYRLSQMLDSHDISRSRDSMENVLRSIAIPALVVGIDSDLLFPCSEQKFMADIMPRACYAQISSIYGHDAFLIEYEQLTKIISPFVGG